MRVLDVTGKSAITDFYVLASGATTPQLKAMANEVLNTLKDMGIHCYHKSGSPESGWVVLDYFDAVIHVFSDKTRDYYAIEDLWDNPVPSGD